jgi:1-acyl-sn-glycerol-3-phosphate acyltransferase
MIGLLSWILLLTPALLLCRLFRNQRGVIVVGRFIYRGLIAIAGIRIEFLGKLCVDHPVLYVSNHCSYFDIMVLGSRLDASFIAKKEVAGWPLIGFIARIASTVFVERRGRHSASQRDELTQRLVEGRDSLILFPEGTSSVGRTVLPFKSALFSVAEAHDRSLPVQPISLAYCKLDGLPLGRNWRSHYSWYGDMDLASHIWMALGLGRATVTVIFHPPVTLAQLGSRKALADYCWSTVKGGVISANRGRCEEYLAAVT